MATWQQLTQYIAQTHKYEWLGDACIKMEFGVGDGRSQTVLVEQQVLGDAQEQWAVLSSAIGELHRIDLLALLRAAGRMICGGLTAGGDGDLLLFRHSVLLTSLDIEEFERPLLLVTGTADRLEQQFVGSF